MNSLQVFIEWVKRTATRKPRDPKVVKVRYSLRHLHGHLMDIEQGLAHLHEAVCQLQQTQHDQHNSLRKLIMASQAQLAQDLQAINTQLVKIGTETTALLAKITELEAAIAAGGTTTPEVDAAVQALRDQAKVVDDLVVDTAP
jgi:G:T/U-mismatch repair DNA glycosylase